ncbi:MAG: cbb3-type cytochrome c oxidase N-terminal domain-containing protein [Flavipsychrobacter sp.]
MFKYFKNIITPMLLVLLTPVLSIAAEGAAQGGEKVNVMLIGLVSLIIVLLFAILILGNTLRQLSFVYRDKMREKRSSTTAKALLVLLGASLLSSSVIAQEAASTASQSSPYINGMLKDEFYALATIIILELVTIVSLIFMIKVMVRVISKKPEMAAAAQKIVKKVPFWDRFNAAVAIEQEEDILLDHDYDGIQELDNSLPPWWKYGFYLTIVVGVIYIWYYHAGGNGLNQQQEYVQSVEKANKEIAKYLASAADNVDENSVVMLDAAGIASGAEMFSTTCVACHAADGGGNSIGPNLTDKYWLHGGSLKDIFKSIKYGWKDKGMQSWQNTYSPKQIAQIASYVKSLQGTTPAAPKDPQGELYVEEAAAADSTSEAATEVAE